MKHGKIPNIKDPKLEEVLCRPDSARTPFDVQNTQDSENTFPAIAQGHAKPKRETHGEK